MGYSVEELGNSGILQFKVSGPGRQFEFVGSGHTVIMDGLLTVRGTATFIGSTVFSGGVTHSGALAVQDTSTTAFQVQTNAGGSTYFTVDTNTPAITLGTNTTFQGDLTISTHNIITDAVTGTKIGTATTQLFGFWNANPVVQQTDGAGLTNNVTVGGTTNQLDNFTSLTVYATDATAIRNDIYQLGRKLKIVDDALRLYGMLS